ncbi:cation:proton antiporter [Litoribrevibacter albus]|uniref:Sodium:proton antiporter n=1 Tax=Litoribrevibacter albus TaxID=1473156 RepID=A0AA37SCC3_9GAMM|nr:cation:proton antiporter [Litoribrevibacter albus]GLQ32701.1 sodium:proton antiporter [Litoribrevibacter albus]
MHYETGLLILVFVILALFIGASVRHLLKGTQIPYTVALLVIGLVLGLIHRTDIFENYTPMFAETLDVVVDISPHLILFVFLPTLIFESAFAMEVHLFRRMFVQIAVLAVPGLIVATLLTAGLAQWAFPFEWSWALCLMFGALISATDPVAVVALLKEVSSRKRLETLIEGESLLNDGTAIVFFSLFYGWVLSGAGQDVNVFAVAAQFSWVVSAGLVIGLVVGGWSIIWLGRVFNDPMIEISLSIMVAYLVFMLAESIHVSGVVAVVALALMYASIGRTRISPEVAGFLHHFWEMMAHIANTLIFLLVGVLVAVRVPLTDWDLWWALVVLYFGIMVIRAVAVTLFVPILKRIGIGITREKAIVLVWGGLRGAVSLALALTVAANDLIPKQIGDQVMFLCAGIVVLTILINGTTMGWVLHWLGLDQLPSAKQATVDKAQGEINQTLNQMLPEMMTSEFLKGADWESVKEVARLQVDLQMNSQRTPESQSISSSELAVACKRRLLETERKHYWSQFEQGTLGKVATSKLVEAVEHALDGEPEIGPRTELHNAWKTPKWISTIREIKGLRRLGTRLAFDHLAQGYDMARGFLQAQDALADHIDVLASDQALAEQIRADVNANKEGTLQHIQYLRESFPEIIHALETQAATRLLLNRERALIQQQHKLAVLDKPEAERMIMDVEARMMALQRTQVSETIRSDQLVDCMPWSRKLGKDVKDQLSQMMQPVIYNAGDVIAEQDKPQHAIGVIVRGTVEATQQWDGMHACTSYGPGETISALALLSSKSPATYVAESPVEINWFALEKLKSLMLRDSQLARAMAPLVSESRISDN